MKPKSRRGHFVVLLTLAISLSQLVTTGAFAEGGSEPSKFLLDPSSPDFGWLLWEDRLEFNDHLTREGKWQKRFDKAIFKMVTGEEATPKYKQRKIWLSQKQKGRLFLVVDNQKDDDKRTFLFSTEDYGRSWKHKLVSERKPTNAPVSVTESKEAVDLNALNASPAEVAAATSLDVHNPHAAMGGTTPIFKALFDLLLTHRPGVSPITFDNFHTILLVDYIPRPDFMFSFDLNPQPRFYELNYKATPKLTLRAGKIWIPFDDMGPHNYFGGRINTSRLAQPNATNFFLPDIWADLGVGIKYDFFDTGKWHLTADLYVVNGFQEGGTDPKNELNTVYPNFATTGNGVDNNGDKSIGGRIHADFDNMLGVGLSAYTGRYTSDAHEPAGLWMVGLDSQFRLPSGTEFRGGYVYMNVGLVPGGSNTSYLRGGGYLEVSQKVYNKWRFAFQGGVAQNDNRVIDTTDQTTVGGKISYDFTLAILSLQYYHDLNVVVGKANYDFTALRLVVML